MISFVDHRLIGESVNEALSEKEMLQYRSQPIHKRKKWLAGRLAIKKTFSFFASDRFSVQFDQRKIEVVKENFSKPVIETPKKEISDKIDISISHCDNFSVVAISEKNKEGMVGVDIEKKRNFKKDTIKSFLTLYEFRYVEKQPLPKQSFFVTLFWSIKEAYLKAEGCGLTCHPSLIELRPDARNSYRLYNKNKEIPVKIWWAFLFNRYFLVKVNILS